MAKTAELCLSDPIFPVNPVAVARDVGAQGFFAQLGDDVYGMQNGTLNGTEIFIDGHNLCVRQHFRVAQEIGLRLT